MALENGYFLHYTEIKKFLKNLLRNRWSDFEIISQKCSLSDLSQKLFKNFDPSLNMALVNGDYFHYADIQIPKKSLKLQVRF